MGCAYLGCGGGESLAEGTAGLAGALKEGLRFSLLSVDDLADDEWVASPYGIGSAAPPPESEAQKYAGLRVFGPAHVRRDAPYVPIENRPGAAG